METPEQAQGTRPFRHWDEEGNFSVAMNQQLDNHPPTVSNDSCGELANIWPTAAVDTLLTAWGYDREVPEGWLAINTILWHHIDNLFSLFTEYERGGPAPLKHEARFALGDYDRANKDKPNWRSQERDRLFDEQEIEKIDNGRWLAEYTLKWLDTGIRLLEVAAHQR